MYTHEAKPIPSDNTFQGFLKREFDIRKSVGRFP